MSSLYAKLIAVIEQKITPMAGGDRPAKIRHLHPRRFHYRPAPL
ncbi:PTS system protein [Klebsiella oxytoca]|nr:PTS system protein [Klebsiella oxytoca]